MTAILEHKSAVLSDPTREQPPVSDHTRTHPPLILPISQGTYYLLEIQTD
jgi:hypothetical protein